MTASANRGWKNYWNEDRIASCEPHSRSTAREIEAAWIRRFDRLPDGSRILDIATGNGVVLAHAALAAEAGGKRFALTGIDLADIDPVRYVSGLPPAVRDAEFMGGVAAEELPFGEAGFDVVVSQYGLEYARANEALAGVERVLAPGGRLIWLAHVGDSQVVAQNRDDKAQVDLLLAPDGPLAAMRQYVAAIATAGAGCSLQSATTGLRSALAAAERYCAGNPPAKVVREVCTVLADTAQRWQAFHVRDLERMLLDCRQRLSAHRLRIEDLDAAVLRPARRRVVERRLASARWQGAGYTELRVGSADSLIGLFIEARRSLQ